MQAAAEAIANGSHTIPLACGHCGNTFVEQHPERSSILLCSACGRETPLATARVIRRQKIGAYIRKGIDVPLLKGRK